MIDLHACPRLLRAVVLTLLACIAMQAVPSKALPIQLQTGSAFSASTAEVSLSARAESVARIAVVAAPVPQHPAVSRLLIDVVTNSSQFWSGKHQTAPPLRWPQSPATSPRGPPSLS